MVRDSLSEARSAIWELRSQSAEKADLAARLSKMAAQVTASTPVKVRLEVHGTYRPLGQAVEDQLVKIGQEAVTNVVRHANAENVDIQLVFEPKKLRMTIADDGHGFAMEPSGRGPAGHYGLQGMRERAGQIKADLSVHSAVGEGTRVSLEATVS
jgi:signal transduction histidine kinase